MQLLLIDISNTRTKIAPSDGDEIGAKHILPTATLDAQSIDDLLKAQGLDTPTHVIASSVVPTKNKELQKLWGKKLTLIDHQADLGINIDYPEPAQIGADRLANAVATAHHLGSPSIAIDFGTAVTFDVLGPDDTYIGGVIAPGLEAMTTYLHEHTALLPKLELKEPEHAIGKSTEQAMLAGAIVGYRGLIKEILAEVQTEIDTPDPIPVIATGGNAHLVCHDIPQVEKIEENLTLEGLRLIARRLLELKTEN